MTELSLELIARVTGGQLYGDGSVKVSGLSTDSRTVTEDQLFVALKGERFDGNDYLTQLNGRVGGALTQRYAETDYPTVVTKDSLKALGDLAKYYASNVISPKVTVSLTGSVGKTTTKEMTASVLSVRYKTAYTKGNFNNHIGLPLTLLSAESDDEALVCEMGMNHKGELEYLTSLVQSDIAMITNIGHSHIENLGSREGIRDAKLEILGGLKPSGTLIVNGDEPLLENVPFDGRIIRVGLSPSCHLWAENVRVGQESLEYTLHCFDESCKIKLPCTGGHNAVNSIFAIAVGYISGLTLDEIQSGLMNYRSVGLRQNIYEVNGVRVIADCYNAGIESMSASLTLLSQLDCQGRRIAVLSDMLELGGISDSAHIGVGLKAKELGIDAVYTVGNAARLISENAGGDTRHFDSKQALAEMLKETLRAGDTVLFKASNSMKLEEVIGLADLKK